ncbi:MAG TPA: family 1 glycosylhydrolase [Tepidisphaeraceae bacterium]|nr:family 1 glycosylhydrolase [Tepidisphaeraceae bacterium]
MPSNFALIRPETGAQNFMFATGCENSYPIVSWKGEIVRRDGMELSKHYQHWREDFDLVRDIGIDFLRYGPPYYKANPSRGHYDWDLACETFNRLRELKIHPIVDLCHFGVPDWLENFQNPEFPEAFAHYAQAFAKKFPWVILYTPVNEIFVCAMFSGLRGWWNERLKSDRAFVTALKHMCRACILAEEAILKVQPQALFVQSESTSYFHEASPEAHYLAYFENQRRFLALDLIYGHDVSGVVYEYLREHGMTREEYHWFLERGRRMTPHCILGNDYYPDNEYIVQPDGQDSQSIGEVFGYYVITHQYYQRYRLPVMHTETNRRDNEQEAEKWLHKEWRNVVRLKADGMPMLGFTWYSLIDQTDWDTGLRELNYRTNPCGLFNKQRQPHPVGRAYQELIKQWKPHLPLNSMSRNVEVRGDLGSASNSSPERHAK